MSRQLDSLFSFSRHLVSLSGRQIRSGEVLVKVLTENDDSGRHGVLIPSEAYDFFPALNIANEGQNATTHFHGFDCVALREQKLSYKYYQRYPERRITCLNTTFNDRLHGYRIAVFLKAVHSDGTVAYYTDIVREKADADFGAVCSITFGSDQEIVPGLFNLRSVDSPVFQTDDALDDLLGRFDEISNRGWIDSLRGGDTGIGYTFESLVGIEENNDQHADFRGIEIKCKQVKEGGRRGGKINLFQQAPTWLQKQTSLERLHMIGQPAGGGLYACHSQVTTTPNNLGLWLDHLKTPEQVDILKNDDRFGYWLHSVLAERLKEKHSRAVFVKADVRNAGGKQRFHYKELIYCERPSVERFVDLIHDKRIVFEFIMSEKQGGQVRNHGYPWRLSSEDNLSDLFSLRVKLR